MPPRIVLTHDLMRPIAHFSHAVRVGETIYVGATAGTDRHRKLAGDSAGTADIAAQTHRMFDNLALSLEQLGGSMRDVVQVKTYLVDLRERDVYRRIVAERVADAPPAHAIAGSWHFPLPQATIELDAIAILGKSDLQFMTALPHDREGAVQKGDAGAQARQMLANLDAALARRGLRRGDIVRLHVTLADIRYWPAIEAVLAAFFEAPFPTRTVVAAALEEQDSLVQIEVVAIKGGGEPIGSTVAGTLATPAMRVGDMLFVGAQTGRRDAAAPPDVEAETDAAWQAVEALVDRAGFPQGSVLRTNNALTHWGDFPAFNRGYGAHVAWPYPPRTTILGALTDPHASLQIEAIADRRADAAAILQVPHDDGDCA